MKILAVAGNGVLTAETYTPGTKFLGRMIGGNSTGTVLRPYRYFLTAGQKARIARNPSYRQKAYAQIRKRLETKVVRK